MKKKFLFALAFALTLVLALCGAACTKEIKLTFETNGGTPVEEIVAEEGGEVTLPTTTKPQYAFDGWYTEEDFSGERFEGTIPTPEKSTKYYAKWSKGYEVKLDTDGGSLTATSVWVKEGESVLDAVKDLVPQKSGLSFGAWFLGERELSSSYRMPAESVTLTAKYKAEYIIQLYLQNLSRTSYQRADEYETVGSGYVNTSVSPAAPAVNGFSVQPAPEGRTPVTTLTLSENAEENLYSFYYDRNEYGVFYDGNPPEGVTVTGSMPYDTVIFGGAVKARESGFTAEQYRFAGWAESADGDVVYEVGANITVRGGVTLYAVWDKGFTDRMGSEDIIFFPRTDSDLAVLLRNGMEFTGTREGNTFSFTTAAGETFTGSVVGGIFCYERKDLEGTYIYYDNYPRPLGEEYPEEERYDETRTLEVKSNLDAVYTENGVKKNGSLAFAKEQGDYLFTSDDGTASFHTMFLNAEDRDKKIFSASGGEFGYYADTSGSGIVVMLDGYGTVFLQFMLAEGGEASLQGMYYIEGKGMAFETYDSFKIVCFINDSTNFLGEGAGWRTFYLCVLPGYWSSVGADYGLYYFADNARGTYENGNETLTLDGHGYYLDSAVYTDKDGKEVKGGYHISVDYVTGTVIEIIDANDDVLGTFRIFSDGSFSPYDASKETEYTEYYLLEGERMVPTMLAVFEEQYGDVAGTKRAEIYTNNSKNVGVHAASGYVTSAPIKEGSDFLLYSFTRTSAEYGFDKTMPETMKFTVTSTAPNNSEVWYDCYSVLEKNGVKNYQIIELPEGTVWANTTVSVRGEGSVYFKKDRIDHCSILISTDEFFNETYGELFDSGTGGGEGQLFKLTPTSGGYTGAPTVGLPTTFYYFDPALSPENGPFENLVLTPDGKACYDDDNNGEWKSVGTYHPSGKATIFGSPIYELVIGGSVRFEFVQGNLYFFGMTYPAYFRRTGMGEEGSYSIEGGALTIDGFGRASYAAGNDSFSGTYYFMADNILRISDAEGTQREFEIASDGSFSALDDCYGTWDLVDGNFFPINNYSRIFFDGKGNYTITANYGQGSTSQGRYELWDAEYGEYVIYQATLDGKKANYHVRFMDMAEYNNYNCVVQELAAGTYVNDEYTVLYLNGFGSGSLRGNRYESEGNFRLIDEIGGVGFGYMEFTTVGSSLDGELYHFLLDYEHGTFRILEETGYYTNIIYFASDLDHIAFRDDGAAFLGNLIGGDYLIIDEDTVRIYQENGPSYNKYDVPLYGGDTYVYTTTDDEGKPVDKTYYRYTGTTFTAEGKIEFLDAEGQKENEKTKTATFSFDIRYRSIVGFETTFEIDGENYGGFELYTYTSRKIDPRLEYNTIVYNIDFTRTSDGKWTFTVPDAGVRSFVRNDHNDIYADGPAQSGTVYHQGGKITFTYSGFGSYQPEETVYDGNFLYFYDETKEDRGELMFTGVKESDIRTVGYNNLGTNFGGYRELREIVFTQNGKTYAIDFYEYESGSFSSVTTYDFLLYGVYEYEEAEAGGYTLGVKYLLHTNLSGSPGYGDENALGKPVAVTLLKGGEPVVAVSTDARYGDTGVWIVENDNGRAGEAFLVTFHYGEGENAGKVLSGSVQKGMVQQVGLSQSYLFYMFVDEDGDLVELVKAWYANTAFASVTDISHEGTVWTFTGREEATEPLRRYTLTFTKGASGNYTVRVTSEVVEEEE